VHSARPCWQSAAQRGGNTLNGFTDFRTENGSSQGQKLALTGLFVPSSLDSGSRPLYINQDVQGQNICDLRMGAIAWSLSEDSAALTLPRGEDRVGINKYFSLIAHNLLIKVPRCAEQNIHDFFKP